MIVARLRVGEPVDIQSLGGQRVARCLLQEQATSDALRENQGTVGFAIAVEQLFETRQHVGDTREGRRQTSDRVGLLLRSEFLEVRRAEWSGGDAVVAEEAVALLRFVHRGDKLGMNALD